jgi:hypothetical protein
MPALAELFHAQVLLIHPSFPPTPIEPILIDFGALDLLVAEIKMPLKTAGYTLALLCRQRNYGITTVKR